MSNEETCEIGIAITTYNRKSFILKLVERIRCLTKSKYKVVICDDGSSDGTVEALKEKGEIVLGGKNKGIAWNKNRGLFYFQNICKAETIILLDDDVLPEVAGWDYEWHLACEKVGHVNFIPPHFHRLTKNRKMTATDLGIGPMVGGMAIGQSAKALANVGYMDNRFGRYGHEHADFSFRFLRAGFGGVMYNDGGNDHRYFYLIDGGITIKESESFGTQEDLNRNNELLWELEKDYIYRLPWRNDEEMHEFLGEFGERFTGMACPPLPYRFVSKNYLDSNPDIAAAGVDSLDHYVNFGIREGRKTSLEAPEKPD
ncbi:glycosyltransferase family 2 protein [Roseomonas genomospecies 6]|uniref:Glycosyltransferase n=1 Tax=Roseomonas genomospecies 6 TaxID=214106 RepID=A0A9W7NGM8_9PROT|nr:glycosyltransferase [Roseomonas genomospecies 6]KAA0678260.1 glycosyltransferase [Roseomonas genomospecies 6]